MLSDLKFVIGAVAKKDIIPELTHIKIRQGWAQGFNGQISSATRINLDIDVMPWASEMIEAIQACDDTVALAVTKTGKLSVKSGNFKCFVPCMEMSDMSLQSFPHPEGELVQVDGQFIEMLRALAPFMANDASRAWAMGIMIGSGSSFATNNVMLAQYYHGIKFPFQVTLPAQAVNEILKRKEPITHIQLTHNSLTIWFGRDKWLRSQLIEDAFPEQLHDVIEAPGEPGVDVSEYPGLFEACEKLKRFTDEMGSIHFTGGAVSTTKELEDGAHIDVPNLPGGKSFNVAHLLILKGLAKTVDFSPFPRPCRFWGINQRLRGVFTGKAA